jgi:hypothetical protein
VGGLALSAYLVVVEYQASPTVRLVGFPLPVGGYELIKGTWRGGLVSPFVALAIVGDVVIGLAAALLPVRVAQVLVDRSAPRP